MTVLVTGGLGYIGSHTVVELVKNGYEVVLVDNLSNAEKSVHTTLEKLTGKTLPFYEIDVLDTVAMSRVFEAHHIDAVIHYAAFKSVPESVSEPLKYYTNNVYGTVCLCDVMKRYGVKNIIFSSSATVYGIGAHMPVNEESPLGTTNPYGTSKLVVEGLLKDMWISDPEWSVALLRYFNPVGAHESGLIGESTKGRPSNLMPRLVKAALGEFDKLTVCGTDYPTPDGTGVRDYIHITDLADGHLAALKDIDKHTGVRVYNLGTGHGYSVMDMIHTFERVNGVTIPYSLEPRRPGDVAIMTADPSKAERELGWKARYGLEDMCRSVWHYVQTSNR